MGLYTPGGLLWALDPSFCDRMLPQFPEGAKSSWVGYNFVTCNDIKVALALPAGSSAPGLVVPEFGSCTLPGHAQRFRAALHSREI